MILGAAVRPDGAPSASLARRIRGGAALAVQHPQALVFCSGAVGRHGPSEASVMAAQLTAAGIDPARLVLDEDSRDTLQTAAAAARFVRAHGLAGAIVCSDSYHLPRTRLILALLGIRTRSGAVTAGVAQMGWRAWVRMRLREMLAIPYDGVLAAVRRRSLLG